jgi:hypothetical protein
MRKEDDSVAVYDRFKKMPQLPGRYVLLEQLGAGGMGAVYSARDQASGRIVAFKQLLASLAGSRRRTIEAMFEREYHTLVRLKHPRVIEVYDYGVSESGPYYTMELLEGRDLLQRSPLDYKEVCAHMRDIASILALLSAHRLVHRDVSPRNVRFARDGRAKLIDFGALHVFGPATDIVGTPPCMAPEVLSKMALDQRTDLYALGAVAYFALSGRHAYGAKRLDELPALWREPPPPPSHWVPEIPAALDALVVSLLQIDPMLRPTSAAAVIDELSAIGGLPADHNEEHEHAAQSYLLSGRMVGRQEQQEWLRQRLTHAIAGEGGEVVLDGPAGIGRSRLIDETALEAQLKGVTVLRGDGQALSQPFGVATALGLQLITTCPDHALEAAAERVSILGHLSDELHAKLGRPALSTLPDAPAERRALLQGALHDWFLNLSRARPILLAIDNLHAVDDNSAAFLAALGLGSKQTKLLMLCSQRSGERVTAPAPVRTMRSRSAHLKLESLSAGACAELVRSLFGEVANTGRLAHLLHARSAGNPQQFMDLAELLVKKKTAKYTNGTWVLPLEVRDDELPDDAEALSDARLRELGPAARSMLEVLCVHERPVSLELSLELAHDLAAEAVHQAFAELLAAQLLLIEDGRYRFAREAVRRGLCERMDESVRREQHRKVAQVLMARPRDDAALLQAGRHLLAAGDETRGADVIAPLGRRLAGRAQDENQAEVVQTLLAALRVYEKQGRPPQAIAEILFVMVDMAYYTSEWRLLFEYGERAIELGSQVLGLNRARALQPWLGRKLALIVASLHAALLFALQPRRNRGWHMLEAMKYFLAMVPAVSGTLVLCQDAPTLRRLEQRLSPLSWLGKGLPLNFLYNFVAQNTNLAAGRMVVPRDDFEDMVALLRSPATVKALNASHIEIIYGGMLCGKAFIEAYRFGHEALVNAAKAEATGIRMWALGAAQARLVYHALRGESEQVQVYRAQVELLAVQGGATWQVELSIPAALMVADFLAGDTIGLRRIVEQLTRRAQVTSALEPYVASAQAMYLTLRGQLGEALELYEKVIAEFAPLQRQYWLVVHAGFAQACNRSGQHARARQLLSDALSHLAPADLEFACLHLEGQRQLALAHAGCLQYAEAVAALDGLLSLHGAQDNAMLVGLLHKARAEVALMMEDAACFDLHFAQLQRCFRATRNPALIAQSERLLARAVKAGLRRAGETPPHALPPRDAGTSAHISSLHFADDPFQHVLKVAVQRSCAKSGYLYIYEYDKMRLVAANRSDEAPRGLETQLLDDVRRLRLAAETDLHSAASSQGETVVRTTTALRKRVLEAEDAEAAAGATQIVSTPPAASKHEVEGLKTAFVEAGSDEGGASNYRAIVLRAHSQGRDEIVGGLILEVDPERALLLPSALLETVADALYTRGTAVTT